MNLEAKKKALSFVKTEKISCINYASLSAAAQNLGYTIIDYTRGINNENVATLISEFRLEDLVKQTNGLLPEMGAECAVDL